MKPKCEESLSNFTFKYNLRHYAEDVKFRQDELTKPLEDEKTLFSLIIATFQSDFENFKERVGVLGLDEEAILRDHWKETQDWASDRTQSLYRCIRGVCLYGSALRQGLTNNSIYAMP